MLICHLLVSPGLQMEIHRFVLSTGFPTSVTLLLQEIHGSLENWVLEPRRQRIL